MLSPTKKMFALAAALAILTGFSSCKPKTAGMAISADAAEKVYVAPGEYDEYYGFVSGGFSGQLSVYGYPSARLLKVLPVFSLDPEKRIWILRRDKTHVQYFTRFCSLG